MKQPAPLREQPPAEQLRRAVNQQITDTMAHGFQAIDHEAERLGRKLEKAGVSNGREFTRILAGICKGFAARSISK